VDVNGDGSNDSRRRGAQSSWKLSCFERFGMGPLAFFRKMRFMACYTLPAPIAIDKNIRKSILRMKFSAIAPCPAHTADIRGIAIHMRMQVRQFEVNGARLRGGREHCAAVDQ
jgi:hypothetical protein